MSVTSLSTSPGPPTGLTVGEGFVEPLGFHDSTPLFSWLLPEGVARQTAYRIQTTSQSGSWDSGWISAEISAFVPYAGKPFSSRERVQWRVKYRDGQGAESAWSEPANFEMGLLSAEDWSAKWIRPAQTPDERTEEVAWLRREFSLDGAVERARLYVTARGVFEIQINGERVGNDDFANGWTVYGKRIDTLTYDVTSLLDKGGNHLLAKLGRGWYSGKLGWRNERHHYGFEPQLLLQLEITYTDGRRETLTTDESWEGTYTGPIIFSSIYDGEKYDARVATGGWQPVIAEADLGPARLFPKPFPAVRVTEIITPVSVRQIDDFKVIWDMGQNMVGRPRLNLPIREGKAVNLRFAEALNPDGSLHTRNYRSAKSTDQVISSETGLFEWAPTFTFHGFRYVELTGGGLDPETEPAIGWVTGEVLHSDLERTGHFTSSHEKLNQLQSNIVWSQRGNFLDIPTDCPQRDERCGWTGDAQVFAPTSMFNYDAHAFWKSWLGSVRDEQLPDGQVPHIVPDILGKAGSPGWQDAATLIPWHVYVRTGDEELLSENYEMMKSLVGWYRSQSRNHLLPSIRGWGDWLQPHRTGDGNRGETPLELIGAAYYARSAQAVADAARVLGNQADARAFQDEAAAVRQAFTEHYFTGEGKLQNAPETQTGYVLALAYEMLPEDLRQPAADHLARLVKEEAGGHLRTGFLGTPHLNRVLDDFGHTDLALEVLFKETYPSWFHSINNGATTMWERWNSYDAETGFNGENMNSLNHYAYGAVGRWLYERLAGLTPDPEQPGYKHFYVRPLICAQLAYARAQLQTPYGPAESGWRREGGQVIITTTVPPNSSATVIFPDGRPPRTLTTGHYELALD